MGFRFRDFEVSDTLSTQRVGTDAMLLGAWAAPPPAGKILDIGTGCGVLAMMVAGKTDCQVDAVEIDAPSASEARENFEKCMWSGRLNLIEADVRGWAEVNQSRYDYIISNPPYFGRSLRSCREQKNLARHDITLSHDELIAAVVQLLAPGGRFALILPAGVTGLFSQKAMDKGLFTCRELLVSPKSGAAVKRILTEFCNTNEGKPDSGGLSILDEEGKFSRAYLSLTGQYHNFNANFASKNNKL